MARVLVLPKRSALVRFELNPAQTIVVGFATIVLAGAFLLSLPVASAAGRPVPFLTALFTATSATCVTGLVVVDTATYFSLFGQLVIMLLIQLGGLGYMTVATLMAMLIGRRIGCEIASSCKRRTTSTPWAEWCASPARWYSPRWRSRRLGR